MRKLSILTIILLISLSGLSQSGKYELQFWIKQTIDPKLNSFLVIYTQNDRFLVQPINDTVFSLSLDSVFSYPQLCTIKFYKNCSQVEAKELKVKGSIRKSSLSLSFFISDTIQLLEVDSNRIEVLNLTFLQQRYEVLDKEIMSRIHEFDLRIGNRLRDLFEQASSRKEKDSIMNLSNTFFKTNVARLNLESTLLPAIKNNLSNPLSLYAMESYIRTARILKMNIPRQLFSEQLRSMPDIQKESKIWLGLKNKLTVLNQIKSLIGSQAPEFINIKDTS